MSSIFRVVLILSLLITPARPEAAVLLTEGFDYANGPLVTVSGGSWQTHSGTSGQVEVSAGRAVLSSSQSEDVSAQLAGEPFPAGTNLNLYVGFTVRFTALPGSPGTYFAHFKDSGSGYRPKLFATSSGASTGKLRLGLSRSENAPNIIIDTDLSLNTDYRVVVRYSLSTGTSTFWLNPAAELDESVSATDGGSLISVTSMAFRQSGDYGGMGILTLDDLIVATTFEEIIGEEPPSPAPPPIVALSLLTYNVKGNGVADWSTNSAQVQAIGRQIQHLNPDVIAFQEIPLTNTWQMTNFVRAFCPEYHLADNSGSDGYIRSVILSRHPINRSQKWLDDLNLTPFGYLGIFTRDLFEAEIAVPGFPEPLHVFTVHLKAGQNSSDWTRRAAEANAISNFFVSAFLTTNSSHPYVLMGDMNEDIANPPASNPQTLERLTSTPTGLRLTTPVNPFTGGEQTISIQSGLFARYDYILPGGLLFSNRVSSQVFRSDRVPSPLPPPLRAGDSVAASDHLPVLMNFANPYAVPFQLLSIIVTNDSVSLSWESLPGATYDIERSATWDTWTLAASNVSASGTNLTHAVPLEPGTRFYRVRRQ